MLFRSDVRADPIAVIWAEAVEPRRERDFVDAESDLSALVPLPDASLTLAIEFLGLSVLLLVPGILFLMDNRSERVDSLVSERSKERYCSRSRDRPSAAEPEPDLSPLSFLLLEGWLPMLRGYGPPPDG